MKVDRNTPEGGAIVAIIDYTSGSAADAPSVTEYVSRVFKKWMRNSAYVAQVGLVSSVVVVDVMVAAAMVAEMRNSSNCNINLIKLLF